MKPPIHGSIARFFSLVQGANNRKAKDVMLPLSDAVDLSHAVAALLARENELLTQIVELQKRQNSPTMVNMDGGSFNAD